jgi:hypothetical protein
MKQRILLAPKTFFPAIGLSELNPSLSKNTRREVVGGLTCACHYEARIVSLLLLAVKIVLQLTKTHHFDDNIVL